MAHGNSGSEWHTAPRSGWNTAPWLGLEGGAKKKNKGRTWGTAGRPPLQGQCARSHPTWNTAGRPPLQGQCAARIVPNVGHGKNNGARGARRLGGQNDGARGARRLGGNNKKAYAYVGHGRPPSPVRAMRQMARSCPTWGTAKMMAPVGHGAWWAANKINSGKIMRGARLPWLRVAHGGRCSRARALPHYK